jgi:hypothetical protein
MSPLHAERRRSESSRAEVAHDHLERKSPDEAPGLLVA